MSIKRALQISSNQIEDVRKFYNVTSQSVERDIKILQDWLVKQPHLPQNIEDDFLERLLLRNKFRIEQTKQKIESYYTVRGQYLQWYSNYLNIKSSKMPAICLYLPKLTPKNHRVNLVKLHCLNGKFEDLNLVNVIAHYLLCLELALRFDYNLGLHYIFDWTGFELAFIKTISPNYMMSVVKLMETAYSGRIIGIHYINAPSGISVILNLVKMLVSPKIFQKLHVHSNLDSLFDEIPQELFPKEYGGNAGSITSCLELWDNVFEENRHIFEENLKRISDESKRIGDVRNNNLFGVEGTFRQINLD